MTSEFLDTKAAAKYLNLSPHTLDRWRWSGDGPQFVKLGRSVRYRLKDLADFVESSLKVNTSKTC